MSLWRYFLGKKPSGGALPPVPEAAYLVDDSTEKWCHFVRTLVRLLENALAQSESLLRGRQEGIECIKTIRRLIPGEMNDIARLCLTAIHQRTSHTKHFHFSGCSDVLSVSALACGKDDPPRVIARMFKGSICPYFDWRLAEAYASTAEIRPVNWDHHIHLVFTCRDEGIDVYWSAQPGVIPESLYRARISDPNCLHVVPRALLSPKETGQIFG